MEKKKKARFTEAGLERFPQLMASVEAEGWE